MRVLSSLLYAFSVPLGMCVRMCLIMYAPVTTRCDMADLSRGPAGRADRSSVSPLLPEA